jgi:hypothetical protein
MSGLDQIGGREAFRERRINAAQQFPPVLCVTPLSLRAAYPDRGAQLNHSGIEFPRLVERPLKPEFGVGAVRLREEEQQVALPRIKLR